MPSQNGSAPGALKSQPHAVAATEVGPMPAISADDTLALIVERLMAHGERLAGIDANITALALEARAHRDAITLAVQQLAAGQGELRSTLIAFLARQSEPAAQIVAVSATAGPSALIRPAQHTPDAALPTPAELLSTLATLHATAYQRAGIADPANISRDVDVKTLSSLVVEASGLKRGQVREILHSHAFAPVAALAASTGEDLSGPRIVRWLATTPAGYQLCRFALIAHRVAPAASLLPGGAK